MKAAFYEQTGPAEHVLVLGDMPDPQPASGEVRVRLQWSGEPPRELRRLQHLRRWSHEQDEQVLT
jgi:NADPH2:quinone reductase